MSWYLRSTDDHDAHRGTMSRGSVMAVCGIRFAPRTIRSVARRCPASRPMPSRSARGANPCRTLGDGHQVGLSILDWRSHAIDERGYHPVGVFRPSAGHLLMMVVQLHEQPSGKPCEVCAVQQFTRARGPVGDARSPRRRTRRLLRVVVGLRSPLHQGDVSCGVSGTYRAVYRDVARGGQVPSSTRVTPGASSAMRRARQPSGGWRKA